MPHLQGDIATPMNDDFIEFQIKIKHMAHHNMYRNARRFQSSMESVLQLIPPTKAAIGDAMNTS